MIENFLYLVDSMGFVPNGGRKYYMRRSQPPLLGLMMESYYDATHDVAFVKKHIATLEKEYRFWTHRRSVHFEHKRSGKTYVLARYRADSNVARPEGYSHDMLDAKHLGNGE